MRSWLSIVAGLLAGLLVAGALLVGFVFVGPDPVRATPSPSGSTAAGSPAASASPAASGPSASASASAPSGSPDGSAVTENFHVGEPAPALLVPQVGGGTIDLSTLRGKPVWVNFMQTTCPPCLDEFPLMNGFAARYAEDGPRDHRGRHPRGRGRRRGVRVRASTRRSRSASTATARRSASGARSPCRSTTGSIARGSSGTARWAGSGPT